MISVFNSLAQIRMTLFATVFLSIFSTKSSTELARTAFKNEKELRLSRRSRIANSLSYSSSSVSSLMRIFFSLRMMNILKLEIIFSMLDYLANWYWYKVYTIGAFCNSNFSFSDSNFFFSSYFKLPFFKVLALLIF